MKTVHKINSAPKMIEFGKTIASFVCKNGQRSGDSACVIALNGGLGAGKTQFVKGLASGMGIKQMISSPTFVICKHYRIPGKGKNVCPCFENFFHIDCYRLRKSGDLDSVNLRKLLADKKNLVVIEWPGLAKGFLPSGALWMDFETTGKNARLVTF